jgi:cell pole-organizing protein PopZ
MTEISVAAPLNPLLLPASFVTKIYKGWIDASIQIGNLNVTASRKLLEESSATATKAMTAKTPWDMQAFLLEQSRLAGERLDGYRRNIQEIATGGQSAVGAVVETQPAPQTAQHAPAPDEDRIADPHAASPHQHEVNPHPPALEEKMISSVVSDVDAMQR